MGGKGLGKTHRRTASRPRPKIADVRKALTLIYQLQRQSRRTSAIFTDIEVIDLARNLQSGVPFAPRFSMVPPRTRSRPCSSSGPAEIGPDRADGRPHR